MSRPRLIQRPLRRLAVRVGLRRRAGCIHDYKVPTGLAGMFEHLGPWETGFVIDGVRYGGTHSDYTHPAMTPLRHAGVLDAVDFSGRSVLELGPLEAGDTLLLCELGAYPVLAIEGRAENVARCLLIKNALRLDRATFVLDDVRSVTTARYGQFDIGLVAGLLYHLDRPDAVLRNLRSMVETLVVATHLADADSPSRSAAEVAIGEAGYRGKLYRERGTEDVHSGLQSQAFWPFEDELLRVIDDAGWQHVDDHPVRDLDSYHAIYLVARGSSGPASA